MHKETGQLFNSFKLFYRYWQWSACHFRKPGAHVNHIGKSSSLLIQSDSGRGWCCCLPHISWDKPWIVCASDFLPVFLSSMLYDNPVKQSGTEREGGMLIKAFPEVKLNPE